MRLSHFSAILVSGFIWFGVGVFLLTKGLTFVLLAARIEGISSSMMNELAAITKGKEQAGTFLIIIGLTLGYLKSRFVLQKSAKRVVGRILSLPNPANIFQIYSLSYCFLILSMVALGIGMKWMHLNYDLRGVIDVFIGSALMNGSLAYFRLAFEARRQRT